MEFEQLIKRLDWLETQQRKTSETTSATEERLASLERDVAALIKQFRTLEKELAEIPILTSRVNQFEEIFTKQRKEMNLAAEQIDKTAQKRELEITKRQQVEWEKLTRSLEEFRRGTDTSDIRKAIKDKAIEEIRISQALADIKARAEEIASTHEKIERTQQAFEESRRTDIKRMADLQGDVTALRKRLDETRDKTAPEHGQPAHRGKPHDRTAGFRIRTQTSADRFHRTTIPGTRGTRASLEGLERAAWKTSKNRSSTWIHRCRSPRKPPARPSAPRIPTSELNQKLERRINEITEIQRLADERSRQEWVTFKAEDQKRWTSYTLSQEESIRELRQAVTAAEKQVGLPRRTRTDRAGSTAPNHRCHRTPDAGTDELGARVAHCQRTHHGSR